MSQKRDHASIFLAFVLPVIVLANHFMFYSASRIGKKVGLSAVKCLGANYYPFLILTLLLSIELTVSAVKAFWFSDIMLITKSI